MRSLTYPQRKKSTWVRSGERGGHAIAPSWPIHRSGKFASRSLLTSVDQCVVIRLAETVWLVAAPLPEGVATHESCRSKLFL